MASTRDVDLIADLSNGKGKALSPEAKKDLINRASELISDLPGQKNCLMGDYVELLREVSVSPEENEITMRDIKEALASHE